MGWSHRICGTLRAWGKEDWRSKCEIIEGNISHERRTRSCCCWCCCCCCCCCFWNIWYLREKMTWDGRRDGQTVRHDHLQRCVIASRKEEEVSIQRSRYLSACSRISTLKRWCRSPNRMCTIRGFNSIGPPPSSLASLTLLDFPYLLPPSPRVNRGKGWRWIKWLSEDQPSPTFSPFTASSCKEGALGVTINIVVIGGG